ncbi:MAG: hypothetical protein LBJ08_04370, partial [Bifidobacteriaceae bacterium]|nr:hypothetical protein [Bifidobacteriaceae bacterium]
MSSMHLAAVTRPLRRLAAVVAGTGLILVGGGLVNLAPAVAAPPDLVVDPAQFVNTMGGTAGSANLFPGPALPFGMVQFSPDTASGAVQGTGNPTAAGFKDGTNTVRGF